MLPGKSEWPVTSSVVQRQLGYSLLLILLIMNQTFSSHNDDTRLKDLPDDQYNVSVFVVEESGLPFNRSATRPRNVSVLEGETGRSA